MQVTPELADIFRENWNKANDEGAEGHRVEAGLQAVFDTLNFFTPLSFQAYQDRTEETAIYPEAGTGSIIALSYVGLGLGEAGEVQGKIKKIIRDANGSPDRERLEAIAAELGDVLWYVARLAKEAGYSLEAIAQHNLDKLASRKERGVLGGSGDNR